MSILELTPSVYYKNLKWQIDRAHVVDTFKCAPYVAGAAANVVGTTNVTSITYADNSKSINLPAGVNSDGAGGNIICIKHKGRTAVWANGPVTMSCGMVAEYRGKGSFTFTLSSPVTGDVNAVLTLSGTTYYVAALTQAWDNYPNLWKNDDDTAVYPGDLGQWIFNNKSGTTSWTGDSAKVPYSTGSYAFGPFISQFVAANGDNPDKANRPDASYIITKWSGGMLGPSAGVAGSWSGAELRYDYNALFRENSLSAISLKYSSEDNWFFNSMWPNYFYPSNAGKGTFYEQQRGNLSAVRHTINTKVTKLSDYSYRVDFEAPWKYVYAACTRYSSSYSWAGITGLGEQFLDLDNYAFVDIVSQIKIDLKAFSYLGETYKYEVSLDSNDSLTTDIVNENVFSIETNELIKNTTKWSDYSWCDVAANSILLEHYAGKYTVETEVAAEWAIYNDVNINSQMYVKLIDGQYITRVMNDGITTWALTTLSSIPNPLNQNTDYEILFNSGFVSTDYGYWKTTGNNIRLRVRNAATYEVYSTLNVGMIEIDYASGNIKAYKQDTPNNFVLCLTKPISSYIGNTIWSISFSDVVSTDSYNVSWMQTNFIHGYFTGGQQNRDVKQVVFQVKNIQKVYKDSRFVYQLKMMESEIFYAYTKIYSDVPSMFVNTEYWFTKILESTYDISRVQTGRNGIIFRRRTDNAGLAILEETHIGRVVLSNTDGGGISLYKWTTGSKYVLYKTITFDDYSASGELWSIEASESFLSTYNPAGIFSNLGGYIMNN